MEGMTYFGHAFQQLGWFGPSDDPEAIQKGCVNMVKCTDCWVQAGTVPGCPESFQIWCTYLEAPWMFGFFAMMSTSFVNEDMNNLLGATEALSVEGVKRWENDFTGQAKHRWG